MNLRLRGSQVTVNFNKRITVCLSQYMAYLTVLSSHAFSLDNVAEAASTAAKQLSDQVTSEVSRLDLDVKVVAPLIYLPQNPTSTSGMYVL